MNMRFLLEIEPNMLKHWRFGTIFSKNTRNVFIECNSTFKLKVYQDKN